MCTTCGCGQADTAQQSERMVRIEQDILADNNHYAEHNRERLQGHGIRCLNLMSSPGAGKTTLLAFVSEIKRSGPPLSVIDKLDVESEMAGDLRRCYRKGGERLATT